MLMDLGDFGVSATSEISGITYLIEELIGQGSFGKVYNCQAGNRTLVIKIITTGSSDTEVKIMKKLKIRIPEVFPEIIDQGKINEDTAMMLNLEPN
jgi:predicted Ser/Thr protein kinase